MKKILLSLIMVTVLGVTGMYAQKATKIGYCHVDYVLNYLPDTKAAQDQLKAHEQHLKTELERKTKEFQAKYVEYEKLAADKTTPASILQSKERELQNMQQNIQVFQQNADQELQKKQVALMQPVYVKINKAIKDVAIENSYAYILNATEGGLSIVLYAPEEHNVSDLILKKLGVTPPAQGSK